MFLDIMEGEKMKKAYDELRSGDRFLYRGERWIVTDLESGDSRTQSPIAVNLRSGETITIEGYEPIETDEENTT